MHSVNIPSESVEVRDNSLAIYVPIGGHFTSLFFPAAPFSTSSHAKHGFVSTKLAQIQHVTTNLLLLLPVSFLWKRLFSSLVYALEYRLLVQLGAGTTFPVQRELIVVVMEAGSCFFHE